MRVEASPAAIGEDQRTSDRAPSLPGARPGSSTGERLGPSTGASVMLDIGPDAGALVVYTTGLDVGDEIEIRRRDEAWTGTHTAVRARQLGSRVLLAGVFGSLPAGHYQLRVSGDGPAGEATWPTSTASPVVSVEVTPGTVVETRMDRDVGLS